MPHPVPIHGVLGGLPRGFGSAKVVFSPGMVKATYGTGSSVMMHIGQRPVFSKKGLVTSLAWGMEGKVTMCWRQHQLHRRGDQVGGGGE